MSALQNRCLDALPAQVLEGWKPHLSLVELRKGDTLPFIGRFDSMFFPVDCVAAIRVRSLDGSSTFMRFSGHEFVIGTAHLIGMGGVRFDVVICGEGHALALPARHFLRSVPLVGRSMNLSVIALATIAERGFAAAHRSRSHSVRQRLARTLLEAGDSFGIGRDVTLSRQQLSDILVVRRETVTALCRGWSVAGLIETKRGAIRILQPSGLAAEACACLTLVRRLQGEERQSWRSMGRSSG